MSKLPKWLIKKTPKQQNIKKIIDLLGEVPLCTVCQSAHCPNIGECFSKNTLTFMIMGDVCTRDCKFCAVLGGMPRPIDPDEPQHIAAAAKKLGLKYVVITSVTRDDLPDGGAGHFTRCINALRAEIPGVKIEVLIPDFQGNSDALKTVLAAGPDVLNHNVETIPRLYKDVRPQANFKRSLEILRKTKEPACRQARIKNNIYTKSGFMVGLGEEFSEVVELLDHLRKAGVEIVTIGQYLAPSRSHFPVKEYVHPDTFKQYKETAREMGFLQVEAGSFVRSSYQAQITLEKAST